MKRSNVDEVLKYLSGGRKRKASGADYIKAKLSELNLYSRVAPAEHSSKKWIRV